MSNGAGQMRSLGVIQAGDIRLRRNARRFQLPAERADAGRVIARLLAAVDRISAHHVFVKGIGLAAPQLGLDRAVAVVRPSEVGGRPLTLLNPEVVRESLETDEKYEGCLSFFEVRGLVPRPLWIEVAHDLPSGRRVLSRFERAAARLVSHETDHLAGVLYTDRMRPDVRPIGLEEYRGTGTAWEY